MAKSSRGMSAKDYKSVGTTFDGVRILAPKRKATSFTTTEIRNAIASVLAEKGSPMSEPYSGASKSEKPKSRTKSKSGLKSAAK